MAIIGSRLKHVSKEMTKQMFISKLLEKGITHDKHGTSIHDMDYYSLRQELVMADFRDRDVDSPDNKWF
ncbi:hypothetical protein [Bacillus sp. T33-2]|uniref:hypothetical protein n=1 Tax=Bacillus sp. T33-2 TaxID=2054168 RepID=UPI000C77AF37|nr:hypothetical protein [Bacillus sp. T33-2]PLR93212.1 hypothetical protein CVD19_19605 [Bacillus sp. T33-2]